MIHSLTVTILSDSEIERKKMIYGIDFDGTIVTEDFPAIGKPIEKTVAFIRKLKENGDKWILITMREGRYLDEALEYLKQIDLMPDAVNDNLPERAAEWGNNPRKVYADVYIDDHNAGGLNLPCMEGKKIKIWIEETFNPKNNTGKYEIYCDKTKFDYQKKAIIGRLYKGALTDEELEEIKSKIENVLK